jgi:hypothetical protein
VAPILPRPFQHGQAHPEDKGARDGRRRSLGNPAGFFGVRGLAVLRGNLAQGFGALRVFGYERVIACFGVQSAGDVTNRAGFQVVGLGNAVKLCDLGVGGFELCRRRHFTIFPVLSLIDPV